MAKLWNQCPDTEKWYETKFDVKRGEPMRTLKFDNIGWPCPHCGNPHPLVAQGPRARYLDELGTA